MSNLQIRSAVAGTMLLVLLAASGLGAQETLAAKLDQSGMITISRGAVELGMIELNAHGPQWKHAPQATATAAVSDLPDGDGKRFVGTLPVPNTEGGAIKFTETVKTLAQGLHLEYDLAVTKTMKLNGLQFSLCLPVAVYAGKDMVISRLEGEPETLGFPQELPFQGWGGEAARIEAAKGTDQAIAIELRAATDAMIQDLRTWERPVYEIRFPAISDDQGREVTTDDRFHLDLTVTLAGPVKLVGP
jgi:hypothetical protein